MKRGMKGIVVLLGVLFMVVGNAYGEQVAPRGSEGIPLLQPGGDEMSPQGGLRHGPPLEAYKACEGKSEGSTAQFSGRDGETVTGTCRMADGKLVLRPDRPRGKSRDDRRGPPPEAYAACEGKSAGSSSQFVNPRGETVKGTCEEEDGKMVLRPDHRKAERQGQINDGLIADRGERTK